MPFINIDWEYIQEHHLMNDDDIFVKLTKKQYNHIVVEIADTYTHIDYEDRMVEMVECYGIFDAMRLYKKYNRRMFKLSENEHKDYARLAVPIVVEFLKDNYSLNDFNEMYEESFKTNQLERQINNMNISDGDNDSD